MALRQAAGHTTRLSWRSRDALCRQVASKSSALRSYNLAVIPGDGIGHEVIPAGLRVLQLLSEQHGFAFTATEYPWSCKYYLDHGTMIPESAWPELQHHDALLLGAVGDPRLVPDHISLRGLLVPIRQRFDQWLNLRPAARMPIAGFQGILAGNPAFDMLVVRENSEGEYAGAGGRLRTGTPDEVAVQTTVMTRLGIERIVRYAFDAAAQRRQHVTSATKSNAMQHAFVFWDEVVDQVAADYPSVTLTRMHADALAASMVRSPHHHDVIVGSNLFGDILSDLAGVLQGSLGLCASANVDPSRRFPSLFEPVHGSAPDIDGQGIANPLATFEAVAMMLDHLHEADAAACLRKAVTRAISLPEAPRYLTPDVGGAGTTESLTDAVLQTLDEDRA